MVVLFCDVEVVWLYRFVMMRLCGCTVLRWRRCKVLLFCDGVVMWLYCFAMVWLCGCAFLSWPGRCGLSY